MSSMTKREDNLAISETWINASYEKLSKKIPSCLAKSWEWNADTVNIDERSCIKNRMSTQYYNLEQKQQRHQHHEDR